MSEPDPDQEPKRCPNCYSYGGNHGCDTCRTAAKAEEGDRGGRAMSDLCDDVWRRIQEAAESDHYSILMSNAECKAMDWQAQAQAKAQGERGQLTLEL